MMTTKQALKELGNDCLSYLSNAVLAVIVLLTIAVPVSFIGTQSAQAAASCSEGYYFNKQTLSCKKKISVSISLQDSAAAKGPKWGPPNATNCAKASAEMDQSAAACRRLDAKKAYDTVRKMVVDGKLLEECATCCRQLREGMARWELCHKKNLAPPPDYITARRSAELLNCGFTY